MTSNQPRSAEIHPGPGFRVRLDHPRPRPSLTRALARFDTPDISDLLNRLYSVDAAITCLTGSHHRLCGPVCTVKVFPGDNLMVHKALDVAQPGDVIVVDARGSKMNAVLGDIISTKARHRKISGFIVDGLIRDLPGILKLDFPVFARGTTPIGPLHRGPGEINYPIACGGTVVNAGDIVVADSAGIVVVPLDIADELLERLERHAETSASYLAAVERGEFSNQWVDRILDEHGCTISREGFRHPEGTRGSGFRAGVALRGSGTGEEGEGWTREQSQTASADPLAAAAAQPFALTSPSRDA